MFIHLLSLKAYRKPYHKFSQILAMLLMVIIPPVAANPLNEADSYFSQKQYNLATKAYRQAAELGKPKAFYQLGAIHLQGLGTPVDDFKALIWFSLASEQSYENSTEISEQLLTRVSQQQQDKVQELIKTFQASFGKNHLDDKYYPKLIPTLLSKKVHFNDGEQLNYLAQYTDDSLLDDLSNIDTEDAFVENFFQEELSAGESDLDFENTISDEQLFNRPYLLIVDYDIAPDGSIRNPSPVQTMGATKKWQASLLSNNLSNPQFFDKNVYFVNRSYLGMASYDRAQMRERHQILYSRIKRLARKLSESDQPEGIYKHAMLLMNFSWLTQQEGEAKQRLKSAAEQNYALAQFEYGLMLYREQKDLQQAIYWIAQATKQGVSQAEYRLGRILLESPWVEKDEHKALFWFESAAQQDHLYAKQKSAEIKLLATNKKLIDIPGAQSYLNELAKLQKGNPEYYYLQAIAYRKMKQRNLAKAVQFMHIAIEKADDLNWNIKPWQQQLASWTSGGSVTIKEL